MQKTWNTRIDEMDLESVPFANEVLRFQAKQELELHEDRIESVDLRRIVGTTNPKFQIERTWGDLKPVAGTLRKERESCYQPMERSRSVFSDLTEDPDFILSRKKKCSWTVLEINEELFVEVGLHRTVIARFFLHLNGLEPIVHGVNVRRATIRTERSDPTNGPDWSPKQSPHQRLMEKLRNLFR